MKRKILSALLAVIMMLSIVPGAVLASALAAFAAPDADIYVHWEPDQKTYALDDTANVELRVDLSEDARERLQELTITLNLNENEASSITEGITPSELESEPGQYRAEIHFSDMTSASLSTSFKVAVPKTFTNDMFQFELCSGEIDVAPTIKYSHTDAAAETAQDDEQVAEPTDTEVKESDPAGNLPAVGGAAAPLSAQLLQNNPEDANELTIEIEPLMLTFQDEEPPVEELTYSMALTADPTTLRPENRTLGDFTITTSLAADTIPENMESDTVEFQLSITLPEGVTLPKGVTIGYSGTEEGADQIASQILLSPSGELLAEFTDLPDFAKITAAQYDEESNTLIVTVSHSWMPDAEAEPPAESVSWSFPLTVHGGHLAMTDEFATGDITVTWQINGEPAGDPEPVTISILEETATLPEGTEVTETINLPAINIYWVDNNDESNIRPSATSFPEPELYFSINDGESKKLTYANMAEAGLTEMPDPEVENLGGGQYRLTYENLPHKLSYFAFDSAGEKVEAMAPDTIEWTMGEQPLVDGYAEVSVTEENAEDYPSADGRQGWFYVLETDVKFSLQVRWGDLGAADGLRDLVMNGLSLYVSTPGYANDQHYTLAQLEASDSLMVDTSASPDEYNPTHGVLTVEGGWKYNLDGSEISYTLDLTDNPESNDRLHLTTGALENGDYLRVTYDNSAAPNVGSIDTECYPGGTTYLTLTGTTGYQATKVWLDEEDSVRPTGEFHLWRYRKGESYTTAAPVQDEHGNPYILELSRDDTQEIIFTQQDGAGSTVPAVLDKYDQEGYRYIYVVREYLDSTTGGENPQQADNYEAVFGVVQDDDSVMDTVLPEGTVRDKNNRFVYDGGTISNRLSDQENRLRGKELERLRLPERIPGCAGGVHPPVPAGCPAGRGWLLGE